MNPIPLRCATSLLTTSASVVPGGATHGRRERRPRRRTASPSAISRPAIPPKPGEPPARPQPQPLLPLGGGVPASVPPPSAGLPPAPPALPPAPPRPPVPAAPLASTPASPPPRPPAPAAPLASTPASPVPPVPPSGPPSEAPPSGSGCGTTNDTTAPYVVPTELLATAQ